MPNIPINSPVAIAYLVLYYTTIPSLVLHQTPANNSTQHKSSGAGQHRGTVNISEYQNHPLKHPLLSTISSPYRNSPFRDSISVF